MLLHPLKVQLDEPSMPIDLRDLGGLQFQTGGGNPVESSVIVEKFNQSHSPLGLGGTRPQLDDGVANNGGVRWDRSFLLDPEHPMPIVNPSHEAHLVLYPSIELLVLDVAAIHHVDGAVIFGEKPHHFVVAY